MKTNTNLTLTSIFQTISEGPPVQPQGIFWSAYDALFSGDYQKAHALLRSAYFDADGHPKNSKRSQIVTALANAMPPSMEDLGAVELLAAAGQTVLLGKLYHAGIIKAIHAVHADIELHERDMPNPVLQPEPNEFKCLIALYNMEQGIIGNTYFATRNSLRWMTRRYRKATKYLSTVEFCHRITVAH